VVSSSSFVDSPLVGRVRIDRRRGNRHLRMRILGYQSIVVSAPLRTPQKRILSFVRKNHKWVTSQSTWNQVLFTDGLRMTPKIRLSVETNGKEFISFSKGPALKIIVPSESPVSSLETQQQIYARIIDYLRDSAKSNLPNRVKSLSTESGLKYRSLTHKNIISRWGSFSSKGNLNLAVQLMRLPEELIDHVILHELCHSRQMSHSEKFWKEFKRVRPQYRRERQQLHKHQLWRKPC